MKTRYIPPTIFTLIVSACLSLSAQTKFDAVSGRSGAVSSVEGLTGTSERLGSATTSPSVGFAKVAYYGSAGYEPQSIATGDVNGDGRPDIVVANFVSCVNGCVTSYVGVLLGNGDGTFQVAVPYAAGIFASAVALADVNGDGKLDIVVANECQTAPNPNCETTSAVSILMGNGDGTFQPPVSYGTGGYEALSVAIADLNGDGYPDIAVANYCENDSNCAVDGNVSILLNKGDGTFRAGASYDTGGIYSRSVAVADVNGDGHADLVVSNAGRCNTEACDTGEISVFMGNGDGTFQPPVFYSSGGTAGESVAVSDVNGDGYPDLIVANMCLTVATCNNGSIIGVLLNNGDGTFQNALTYSSGGEYGSSGIAVADVNGDGKPDIVLANSCVINTSTGSCGGNSGTVSVLAGNGNGTFQAAVVYQTSGREGPSAVAITDVNGDHRPDLLVSVSCPVGSCGPKGLGAAAVFLNNFTATTKTALTSSPNSSFVNQSVRFTATISSNSEVPNGSVITFYQGTAELGTGTTTNGVATLTTSFSKKGAFTIKAEYAGDVFHKASSGAVNVVVNTYSTTTALSTAPNPSAYGQAVLLTAVVSTAGSTTPTGAVTFYNGTSSLGTGTLDSTGAVILNTVKLSVGSDSLTAKYLGDTLNEKSTSAAVIQTVQPAKITMTLISSPNPSASGKSVKFTATLTSNGNTPNGQTVMFSFNGGSLGTATISGGKASYSTATLPVGTDKVTASYAGDVDHSSASASASQTVN